MNWEQWVNSAFNYRDPDFSNVFLSGNSVYFTVPKESGSGGGIEIISLNGTDVAKTDQIKSVQYTSHS